MFFRAIIRKLVVVSQWSSADSPPSLPPDRSEGTKFHSDRSPLPDRHFGRAKIVMEARAEREKGAGHSIWARASPNGTETKDDRQYRKFYPSNIDRKEMIGESRRGFGSDLFSLPSRSPSHLQNSFFATRYSMGRKITKQGPSRARETSAEWKVEN